MYLAHCVAVHAAHPAPAGVPPTPHVPPAIDTVPVVAYDGLTETHAVHAHPDEVDTHVQPFQPHSDTPQVHTASAAPHTPATPTEFHAVPALPCLIILAVPVSRRDQRT